LFYVDRQNGGINGHSTSFKTKKGQMALIPYVESILDIQSSGFKRLLTPHPQKKKGSRFKHEKLSFADILKEEMSSIEQGCAKPSLICKYKQVD
jgi:hypothetical protein